MKVNDPTEYERSVRAELRGRGQVNYIGMSAPEPRGAGKWQWRDPHNAALGRLWVPDTSEPKPRFSFWRLFKRK